MKVLYKVQLPLQMAVGYTVKLCRLKERHGSRIEDEDESREALGTLISPCAPAPRFIPPCAPEYKDMTLCIPLHIHYARRHHASMHCMYLYTPLPQHATDHRRHQL